MGYLTDFLIRQRYLYDRPKGERDKGERASGWIRGGER